MLDISTSETRPQASGWLVGDGNDLQRHPGSGRKQAAMCQGLAARKTQISIERLLPFDQHRQQPLAHQPADRTGGICQHSIAISDAPGPWCVQVH